MVALKLRDTLYVFIVLLLDRLEERALSPHISLTYDVSRHSRMVTSVTCECLLKQDSVSVTYLATGFLSILCLPAFIYLRELTYVMLEKYFCKITFNVQ